MSELNAGQRVSGMSIVIPEDDLPVPEATMPLTPIFHPPSEVSLDEPVATAEANVESVRLEMTDETGSAPTTIEQSPTEPGDAWKDIGFVRNEENAAIVPPKLIVFEASGDAEPFQRLVNMLESFGEPPLWWSRAADRSLVVYRKADTLPVSRLRLRMPHGVVLSMPGDRVMLPEIGWQPGPHAPRTIDGLPELGRDHIIHLIEPEPVMLRNPLLPFSLRGQSEKFRQMVVDSKPLLGDVCLRGQVTVWYAGANTGKTLIALSLLIDAVREERIAAGNVYYINADDSGSGFASKLQLMDDIGANTLAPGFNGFQATDLIALLHAMADKDEAKGVFVLIDTIKKFASLMDKKELAQFAQACRRVSMMGGTVLGLAHTAKNPNSDGSVRYAGVTDLVEDADAAYTINVVQASSDDTEKVVEFRCFKARGDSAERAAYAYAAERGISYEDLLGSVRSVDAEQLDGFKRIEAQRSDAELIEAVAACLGEGINTKMVLAKETASRTGISVRAATKLIDQYSGTDPGQHRWQFKRANRGAQVYELLAQPDIGAAA